LVGNKFQDIILKYSRDKIGEGKPDHFDATADEINTLCGDEIRVFLRQMPSTVDIRYQVKGCALCAASASVMSETVSGQGETAARILVERFLSEYPGGRVIADLGTGIEALFDMKRFPARERCVLLPWQALNRCFI
jgi:nitrogen fixation protein NifU and related proteins